MTQFHVGQEVEVLFGLPPPGHKGWRKATIVCASTFTDGLPSGYYTVRFKDGSHGLVDAAHIRVIAKPPTEHQIAETANMTQPFREGQKVEIRKFSGYWRKAAFIKLAGVAGGLTWYEVQFRNGRRVIIDAEHIRAGSP